MKYFIHLPMKMEPRVSSETSAIRTRDTGELPKKEQITFRTWRKLKNKNVWACIQICIRYPYDDFMTTQPEKFNEHDLIIELAVFV